MVARCANPRCNSEFRELSKGRLFLLPPTPDIETPFASVSRLIDHCYWLCPQCAGTHTISIQGATILVSKVVQQDGPGFEEQGRPVSLKLQVGSTA